MFFVVSILLWPIWLVTCISVAPEAIRRLQKLKGHYATLIPQAAEHLAAELAERGRLPVLLIDEAHLLSHDQLEAIRMLTSAQLDSASPLAVLLIGQPHLRASMKLGVLAALVISSLS